MEDPRAISAGSNMPAYPWLLANDTDVAALPGRLPVQRTLGVPSVPSTHLTPADELTCSEHGALLVQHSQHHLYHII